VSEHDAVVARNVSLYPEQHAVLIQVAKDTGLGNVSAALRYIITDWVKLKRAAVEAATPNDGYETTAFARAGEVR
jgi:hypothetical protein